MEGLLSRKETSVKRSFCFDQFCERCRIVTKLETRKETKIFTFTSRFSQVQLRRVGDPLQKPRTGEHVHILDNIC